MLLPRRPFELSQLNSNQKVQNRVCVKFVVVVLDLFERGRPTDELDRNIEMSSNQAFSP